VTKRTAQEVQVNIDQENDTLDAEDAQTAAPLKKTLCMQRNTKTILVLLNNYI